MVTGHHPVDILIEEHEIILQVLSAIERKAAVIEDQDLADEGFWHVATGFLVNFVDRRHHWKEEEMLFPALVAGGLQAHQAPLSGMSQDHVKLRAALLHMRDAVGARDAVALTAVAREYVALARSHIQQEQSELYETAREVLSADVVERLWYELVELDRARNADLDYAKVARELCAAAGLEFHLPEVAHH